jgi:hypothetical protein
MGRRRTQAKRDRAIFAAYQAGRSSGDLAAEHALSRQRVLQIVAAEGKRSGVPLRPCLSPPRPPGLRTTLDPAAAEAYRAGSRPTGQIASDLGLKPATLRQRMRSHGVPRTPFSAGPTLQQRAYDLFKGGKSLKEVAEALGISRQAASVYVVRGRKKDPDPYYRHESRRPRPAADE